MDERWSLERIALVMRAHGASGVLYCIACLRNGERHAVGTCPPWKAAAAALRELKT